MSRRAVQRSIRRASRGSSTRGGGAAPPAPTRHPAGPRGSRRRAGSPVADLTSRELQVLALVAEGDNNERIAELLVLSKGAVEKHINSIFGKLGLSQETGVSSRVKATLLYLGETA